MLTCSRGGRVSFNESAFRHRSDEFRASLRRGIEMGSFRPTPDALFGL